MSQSHEIKTITLQISGMFCGNCEEVIRKKLSSVKGIEKAEASYRAGTASVAYDANAVTLDDISAVIKDAGYEVAMGGVRPKTDKSRAVGMLIIIAAIYIVLQQYGLLNYLVPSKLADVNMGYGLLFAIGLLTSVHCIAMCGGINISQCIRSEPAAESSGGDKKSGGGFSLLRSALLYNVGRVASYTMVGFVVGALGSAFTLTLAWQGVLKLIAGVFMVMMGITMLDLFPQLRRVVPKMPKFIANKINAGTSKSKSPLIVGFFNGFMPCGPLQAAQIYALSTGSPTKGALSMMLFALGTVPLMLGLGVFSSIISKKSSKKALTAGAVMVATLGLCMLTQGWNLFGMGSAYAQQQQVNGKGLKTTIDLGPQVIVSTLEPYGYPSIRVEPGRPVKWVINAPQSNINGCNYRFIIKEYGIQHTFKPGENVIEFTPTREGRFPYYCWMGMIPGMITVAAAGSDNTGGAAKGETAPAPRRGGCCQMGG